MNLKSAFVLPPGLNSCSSNGENKFSTETLWTSEWSLIFHLHLIWGDWVKINHKCKSMCQCMSDTCLHNICIYDTLMGIRLLRAFKWLGEKRNKKLWDLAKTRKEIMFNQIWATLQGSKKCLVHRWWLSVCLLSQNPGSTLSISIWNQEGQL